jgi:signal peptidase I
VPLLNERAAIRAFAAAVLLALALAAGIYFINPLRTASHDPRLRIVGFTVFKLPSRSMEPTIGQNATFVVSAWPYRNADPSPGDIVVFQYPLKPSEFFTKRVIAGGDSTIEIVDGVVIVNGKPVEEPYLDRANNKKDYSRRMPMVHVPSKAFFVMGDSRDDSFDSRAWGSVPRSHVVGKVVLDGGN